MPSNGCDQLSRTALKAGTRLPTAKADSRPGSHRFNCEGGVAR
jgi:hypothetical protein